MDVFFQRHGPKAVFFGRFIGFARALVPFVAGTSRMPYRQFLLYNALGASWQVAGKWIGRTSLILACVVVLPALVAWRRRRRARTARPASTGS